MPASCFFVVGGTSGIGLETAHELRRRGDHVMVGGRGLANRRDDANFIPVDVTEEVSVRLAAQSVSTLCEGRLNGLVYSVGMARPPVPIEAFDPLAFEMVHRTNVIGALLVLKYLFPSLRAARGRVVIVNSVSAHIGSRLSGIDYTMSKAALSGMVRQLALQWAPDGVLINSVFPGMTRTPMLLKKAVSPRLNHGSRLAGWLFRRRSREPSVFCCRRVIHTSPGVE